MATEINTENSFIVVKICMIPLCNKHKQHSSFNHVPSCHSHHPYSPFSGLFYPMSVAKIVTRLSL